MTGGDDVPGVLDCMPASRLLLSLIPPPLYGRCAVAPVWDVDPTASGDAWREFAFDLQQLGEPLMNFSFSLFVKCAV